ncbi:MAG TPA: ADP-ribosylglycohydrolase family protein [Syntrophorhabdaceae bacterium]|nr:ADP-ribosylglycohydrolase family protein [Syntrophorhabdaceae bacterium]
MDISLKDRMLGGLWGAIVGDALGVPVEFKDREERKKDPVTDMRGYGTFSQPPGTWSDDSSLLLCTAESLIDGFNVARMGELFVRWFIKGYWTPHGIAFDIGNSTMSAIRRMMNGTAPETAGGESEHDNGNGSLMRILPVAVYCVRSSPSEVIDYAHRASALTHRHYIAQAACAFYCIMAKALLQGANPHGAYELTSYVIQSYYDKMLFRSELPFSHFSRLFSGAIDTLPENEIGSDGFVVHTLEAGVWCLLNSGSYKEAVLRAVNLGEDTDTTAIVTGGLAGICYGYDAIPQEWIDKIVRKDDIKKLFERFIEAVNGSLRIPKP